MYRVLAALLTTAIIIAGGHFIRSSLHGGHRPAHASTPSGSPFEQCMAEAKRSFGRGTLPDSIQSQFTLDCEARVGR